MYWLPSLGKGSIQLNTLNDVRTIITYRKYVIDINIEIAVLIIAVQVFLVFVRT